MHVLSISSAQQRAAADLKRKITEAAGQKYGLDLDAAGRARVEALASELAGLSGAGGARAAVGAGATWRLIYSNSTGNSNGKLGPFITDVEQVFPAEEPGVYYNVSRLGPITATLRGECSISPAAPHRVNLEFKDVTLRLAGLQLAKKEWEAGKMRGHWAATYWDDDMRVFLTNKGSLFVMGRKA